MSKYRIGQKLNVIVESIDRNGKAKFRVIKEDINSIRDKEYVRPDVYNYFRYYFDNEIQDEILAHGGDENYWEKEENWDELEAFAARMGKKMITACKSAGINAFGDLNKATEAAREYIQYGDDTLLNEVILGV